MALAEMVRCISAKATGLFAICPSTEVNGNGVSSMTNFKAILSIFGSHQAGLSSNAAWLAIST
jgi:hypothetical protein